MFGLFKKKANDQAAEVNLPVSPEVAAPVAPVETPAAETAPTLDPVTPSVDASEPPAESADPTPLPDAPTEATEPETSDETLPPAAPAA